MYECLDQHDGEKLRDLLCQSSDDEHRLVCTLRLPKGKRPSRTREDVKVNVNRLLVPEHREDSSPFRPSVWLAISIRVMTIFMTDYLLLVVKLLSLVMSVERVQPPVRS